MRHRAAYLAFDRFPSGKGSAVHIAQMADELFERFGGGLLGVLGGGGLPGCQREGAREIVRFEEQVPNLIDRAEAYSAWAAALLREHAGSLEVVHVRDPWSALPALTTPPPAHSTGRVAVESASATRATASASGTYEVSLRRSGSATSARRYCWSTGISTAPGWGRPARMSSATAMTARPMSSVRRTVSTRRHSEDSMSPWCSASCRKPLALPR